MPVKSIRLFFQEGTSDKVYNAAIVAGEDGKYTVEVEWGRRGSSLNQGTKAVGVTLAQAERAYDKVVREKTRKGYEEWTAENVPAAMAPPRGEGSASRAGTAQRSRRDQAAQLLNNVDDSELEAFFGDDAVVAQQKFDGKRVIAHVEVDGVVTTNREGQLTGVDQRVLDALRRLPVGTVIDGELVPGAGDAAPMYWLFDLLEDCGESRRDEGYLSRYDWLHDLLDGVPARPLMLVPSATGAARKRELFDKLVAARAEGIVFKRGDAPYRAGRPASGGPQRKYKFVKSADVLIVANSGNAYRMALFDGDGASREVGNVFAGTTNDTRAALDAMLRAGERPVAEVQYLYATDNDQLYQPVFQRLRDDKPAEGCTLEQLERSDKHAVVRLG